MSTRYVCCDEPRRALLADPTAPAAISGIDYLEVQQGNPVSAPTLITLVLVKPLALPAAQLTGDNIRITGGVRFPAPRVDPVVQALPGAGTVASYVVTIPGGQQTDYSTYRLEVVAGPGQAGPPAFLDPHLAAVDFSFKVDCGSELDCAEPPRPPEADPADDPELDYLARDWEGFRRLMLDRLSVLVPGFREDDAVDLTTTLVEALAYRLDQQSYRVDWTTTEAFLDTARSRTSLVRHARLVDYVPGEGASARTFVSLGFRASPAFPDGQPLPAHTPVLPRQPELPTVVTAPEYVAWLRSTPDLPVVFETLARLRLWQWRSSIQLHTWGDEECCVPRGATGVTLVDTSGGPGALAVGDLLLLEEVASPETGEAADADPQRRHVVRLVSVTPTHDVLFPTLGLVEVDWDAADALPFDLVVSRRVQGASGPPVMTVCAAARANVVLAEHGASLPPPVGLGLTPADTAALAPRLDPPAPEPGSRWRPRVWSPAPPARVSPHGPDDVPRLTARALLASTGGPPALTLRDAFSTWRARTDLLASGAFGRDFVVETDAPGASALRFGDGLHGLAPTVRATLGVEGRFGAGPTGNLGAGALGHVVVPSGLGQLLVDDVSNPLPGRGGSAPEPAAVVRAVAPEAFHHPQRAVTADDYAAAVREHPEVSDALAVARWTGAWQTILVHVDREGGRPVDTAFRASLMAHLETYRLAGFDVAVRAAKAVPLDVELAVCALPGEIRGLVGQRVRAALTPVGPDGGFGFFHPDRFTFGTPLYLSALVAAVMAVPGVQSVTPVVFQRFARLSQGELALGVVKPGETEVLELRDDPSFPERGRLRITMGGGR
ncbi:MAG TPA: baseplate J/gp47 family protein [Nocardioides sp.]|nr:baseplate J/gp47 family protein [Nocardioides sp.]